MSLTVFVSPNTKTGTTTLANYTAMQLAYNTKEMVLLIEFSRFTGRSIYINRQVGEKRRSLKNVVLNPTDFTVLKENIMLSKNNSNLYFLSMNLYEDFLELKTYASTSLTRLISNAKNYFQHIVIDLPSNFEEAVVGATLGETFDHKIDNIFMVLDEDVLTFKLLYDFSAVLRLGNAKPLYVTYIFNKTTKHYVDFVENHLELPLIKPLNMIKLMYVDEMVDCCNRGTPLGIGRGKAAKNFLNGISTIGRIALSGQKGTKQITGIGVKAVKQKQDDSKVKLNKKPEKSSLFSKDKNKGKRPKKQKQVNPTQQTQPIQPTSEPLFEEEIIGEQPPLNTGNINSNNMNNSNNSFAQPMQQTQQQSQAIVEDEWPDDDVDITVGQVNQGQGIQFKNTNNTNPQQLDEGLDLEFDNLG